MGFAGPLERAALAILLSLSATPAKASGAWIELGLDLPPGDDVSFFGFGRAPGELWVGTEAGYVWRSRDDGATFTATFAPMAFEPPVQPRLMNLRASGLPDLARGGDRDLDPRERSARAREQADLAGNVRARPRAAGAPLLASLVRAEARDRIAINQVESCGGVLFVATMQGLWRSTEDGRRFEPSALGGESVDWVSCDPKRPGRLAVTVRGDIFESIDAGATFFAYRNPPSRPLSGGTASFDAEGRLLLFTERRVLRETPEGRGYQPVCELVPDSLAASEVRWAWWVPTGRVYGISGDGVLVCDGERAGRLADLRLRDDIRYLWVDEPRLEHLFVATRTTVFESDDAGGSFREIFTVPTQRAIQMIKLGPAGRGDLAVVTGGQIFRQVAARAAGELRSTGETLAAAPLWQVVRTALDRVDLTPNDLAARRLGLRLRSLMPHIVVRALYAEGGMALAGVRGRGRRDEQRDAGRSAWEALALWDLGDLVLDRQELEVTWADLERLRARLTYRLEDAWVTWAHAQSALADAALAPSARAYQELRRREAAAYLDELTGGAFPVFAAQAAKEQMP